MKCEEIESLMIDYLDNSLDEKVKSEVESHITGCGKCLDSFNESKKILEMISGKVMEQPDGSLRANFYYMLNKEIRKSDEDALPGISVESSSHSNRNIFMAAAGLALLVAGTFLGMIISSRANNAANVDKIEVVQAQLDEMKRNAMVFMLKDESSSFRLQGVSYAEELGRKDDAVVSALLDILNNDKNTNVRMAAAFSLSKYTDNRMVCDSLVASLPKQTEPILQITLINILVGIKEKSAERPIRQLINNENTFPEVRSVAEKGVNELTL